MDKNKYYCRINGRIYNLEKIQNVLDKNPQNPNYGEVFILAVEEYKLPESIMLDEVIKFNNNEIPADYNECLKRMQDYNQRRVNVNTVTCPYCHSSNVKKITNTSRAVHTALFGVFSLGRNSKNYHCNKCKSDF